MFFEFDSKAIQAACKKALKKFDYKIVTLEDSNRINVKSWWDKDPEHNYCVDIHSGTIVIEHFDENFENGIEESIGEFRCYYLYRYDPQGNYLDILDNADAISGDLCTAIEALKNSKEF